MRDILDIDLSPPVEQKNVLYELKSRRLISGNRKQKTKNKPKKNIIFLPSTEVSQKSTVNEEPTDENEITPKLKNFETPQTQDCRENLGFKIQDN